MALGRDEKTVFDMNLSVQWRKEYTKEAHGAHKRAEEDVRRQVEEKRRCVEEDARQQVGEDACWQMEEDACRQVEEDAHRAEEDHQHAEEEVREQAEEDIRKCTEGDVCQQVEENHQHAGDDLCGQSENECAAGPQSTEEDALNRTGTDSIIAQKVTEAGESEKKGHNDAADQAASGLLRLTVGGHTSANPIVGAQRLYDLPPVYSPITIVPLSTSPALGLPLRSPQHSASPPNVVSPPSSRESSLSLQERPPLPLPPPSCPCMLSPSGRRSFGPPDQLSPAPLWVSPLPSQPPLSHAHTRSRSPNHSHAHAQSHSPNRSCSCFHFMD